MCSSTCQMGQLEKSAGMRTGVPELIKSLNEGSQYRFLGVLQNTKQEDNMVLESVEKEYLKRVSVIWPSPLSDYNKVLATNQFSVRSGLDCEQSLFFPLSSSCHGKASRTPACGNL